MRPLRAAARADLMVFVADDFIPAIVSVPLDELRHHVDRTSVSSPVPLLRSEAYAARLDLAFVERYLGAAHAPAA